MKNVFTNRQLAHVWAAQTQESGRNPNNSMFFHGDKIWSYGSHHVIAKMYDGFVLMNSETYSNTTAKQHRDVRQAVSHKTILYCPVPDEVLHPENENWHLENIAREIENLLGRTKYGCQSHVFQYVNILNTYYKFAGIKKEFKLDEFTHNLVNELSSEKSAKNKEREKLKQEKRREYDLKILEQNTEIINRTHSNLHLWLLNKDDDLKPKHHELNLLVRKLDHDLVRVKDSTTFETQRGAEVPFEAGFILLQAIPKMHEKLIGQKVGHFQINEIEKTDDDYLLKIGCHTISWRQSVKAFDLWNEIKTQTKENEK